MSQLMTMHEVSAYLQIHEMTLYRLAKAWKIPPLKKVGGRWRCDRVELESWFFSGPSIHGSGAWQVRCSS